MNDDSVQPRMSGHRTQKREARDLLQARDWVALSQWATNNRNPLRTLHMLLWDTAPLLRWRAVEAIGVLTRVLYANEPGIVREFIRKLFWSMNDESGSLCPHAPEALAEIMFHSASFRQEFLEHWLSFLDEEPFEVGVRDGIVRLSKAALSQDERSLLQACVPALITSITAVSSEILGHSVLALRALGQAIPDSLLPSIYRDKATVQGYDFDRGVLSHTSLAESIE